MAKNFLMTKLGIGALTPPPPVPTMPEGLVQLMEELSRNVLKNNPSEEDLYQFCADHMNQLLNLRGAREGRKPLSLEKKIKRAQERVRQKSEQHRRKFDEYLKQLPLFTDGKESDLSDSIQNKEYQAKEIETNCEDTPSPLQGDKPDDNADNIQKEEQQLYNTEKQIDDIVKAEEQITEQLQAPFDEIPDQKDTENVSNLLIPNTKVDETENNEESVNVINNENFETDDDGKKDCEQAVDNVGNGTVEEIKISDNLPLEHNLDINLNNECEDNHENGNKLKTSESVSASENLSRYENEEVTTDKTVVDSTEKLLAGDIFIINANRADAVIESTKLDTSDEVKIADTEEALLTNEEALENKNVENNIITNITVLSAADADDNKLEHFMEQVAEPLKIEQTFTVEEAENPFNEEKLDGMSDEYFITNIGHHYDSQKINTATEPAIEKEDMHLTKSLEIIDEDSLKENEVIIVTKSNSNDQETSLISVNNFEHSLLLNGEKDDADKIDIDINAIARSDSVKEESNENVSDSNTANDVEEMNHPSMDLETAAITIQKVFRTFMFKSRANTLEDAICNGGSLDASYPSEDMSLNEEVNLINTEDEYHHSNIKERRHLGLNRMDTVLQTVNEEKSLSLSDDSSMSSAATIIQAHVRGFLVRNKLHSYKTTSLNSLVNSDGKSGSLEIDSEPKNKKVLNIHIVPEGGHFMSRDESMAMSLDLPYDNSPPCWGPSTSFNLHPLSERRKQLKREDAIQSISPPSNNSGKLSEDVESLKDLSINGIEVTSKAENSINETLLNDKNEENIQEITDNEPTSGETTPTKSVTGETVIDLLKETEENASIQNIDEPSTIKMYSDETDVVTKAETTDKVAPSVESDNTSRLLHSGEFHDLVLPTSVSRADTSVVREFKNVVVKYLLWNNTSS